MKIDRRNGLARRLLPVAAAMLLTACHVGPQVEQTNLGRDPYGANLLLEIKAQPRAKRTEYQGELLEVQKDAFIVLVRDATANPVRILRVPLASVYRAKATDLPGIAMRTSQGDRQRAASLEDLRRVSRYPQGLTADQTDRLLAHYGQSELAGIDWRQ